MPKAAKLIYVSCYAPHFHFNRLVGIRTSYGFDRSRGLMIPQCQSLPSHFKPCGWLCPASLQITKFRIAEQQKRMYLLVSVGIGFLWGDEGWSWCPKPSCFIVNSQQWAWALSDVEDMPILLSSGTRCKLEAIDDTSQIQCVPWSVLLRPRV